MTNEKRCGTCKHWSGQDYLLMLADCRRALCMHPIEVASREKGYRSLSRSASSYCDGFEARNPK